MNLLISNQNVNKIKMSSIERLKSLKKDIESSKNIEQSYQAIRHFIVFIEATPSFKKLVKQIEQRESDLKRKIDKQWSAVTKKYEKELDLNKLEDKKEEEKDFRIFKWYNKNSQDKFVQKHRKTKDELENDLLIEAWNQLKEIKLSYDSYKKRDIGLILSNRIREQEENKNKESLRNECLIAFEEIYNFLLDSLDNKNKNQELAKGNKMRKKKMGLPIPSIKIKIEKVFKLMAKIIVNERISKSLKNQAKPK